MTLRYYLTTHKRQSAARKSSIAFVDERKREGRRIGAHVNGKNYVRVGSRRENTLSKHGSHEAHPRAAGAADPIRDYTPDERIFHAPRIFPPDVSSPCRGGRSTNFPRRWRRSERASERTYGSKLEI